jgi:hypothetical protein
VWLNWLVAVAIAVAMVFLSGRWLTPNVYTVPLGRCAVDWHVDRGIVAVACVGRDMIRVWPLPVEGQCGEDALEMPDGELACRAQHNWCRSAQTRAMEIALSVV